MRNSAVLNLVPALPRFPLVRAALRRTNKSAGIAFVVLVCLFWAHNLRPQWAGGRAAYVLVSGKSMLPRYHTGDLVLVLKQPSYHRGQVIAYRVPKSDPLAGAQVIHRIVGGDARHGFIVQGDNRSAPDVWRPKPVDIVGVKELRVPNAILILQFFRSPLLLALLAACFAFVQILAHRSDEPEAEAVDEDSELRPAA